MLSPPTCSFFLFFLIYLSFSARKEEKEKKTLANDSSCQQVSTNHGSQNTSTVFSISHLWNSCARNPVIVFCCEKKEERKRTVSVIDVQAEGIKRIALSAGVATPPQSENQWRKETKWRSAINPMTFQRGKSDTHIHSWRLFEPVMA